jgi:hypothetical protein
MAHTLVMLDGAALATGRMEGVVPATQPSGVRLDAGAARVYPLRGTWVSGMHATKYPFTELLPSWNLDAPPGTGARLSVRVRDARTGKWSVWLDLGAWGRVPNTKREARVTEFAGRVEIDILELDQPADAFEVRAGLYSYDAQGVAVPTIRRVAIVYSKPVKDESERAALAGPIVLTGNWNRDLAVPFRAQGVQPRTVRSEICSPTSVGMVMAYRGVDKPPLDVAQAIYDNDNDLFGNWGRAVCYPSTLGLDTYLTRFSSMDEARAMVAQGQPVIASIRFKRGEFPSNVSQSSNGHLIVIRGFTSEGDPIVNDPASKDRGNGVVYKADELARAWFESASGVAYIIRKNETIERNASR